MRLVCPNCDAEYEIDPSAIPDSGRDVQCSNCGNAWFEPSPTRAAALAEESELFDAPRARKEPAPAPARPGQPRSLDDTLVAVLREEAEREAAARRAEAGQPIETQTELGLGASGAAAGRAPDTAAGPGTPAKPVSPARPATPARPVTPFTAGPAAAPTAAPAAATASPAARHIARLKGAEPDPRASHPQTPQQTRPQTRRDMLPAIEEINSTLRAASEKRTGEPAAVADSRSDRAGGGNAFRSGFVLMLVLAATGVAAYILAPRLSLQIPGLAPAMTAYVTAVDAGRLWLDTAMQQAIATLRGLSGDTPT